MQQFTQQQFRDAFKACNEATRDFITSEEARSVMNAVANEFSLNPEQIQKYGVIFDAVLYGLVPLPQTADVLAQDIGVDIPQAQRIVSRAKETFLVCLSSTSPLAQKTTGSIPSAPTVPGVAQPQLTATSIHTAIDTYGLVRERLERLPESVQKTIRSPELEAGLSSLVTKYKLDSTKVASYVAEAVRVMVGLTTTNNFKMEVTRTTALDPNTLDALFLDSESILFKPVRMAIMQALEERKTVAPVTPLPTSPKPPSPPSVDPYREPV